MLSNIFKFRFKDLIDKYQDSIREDNEALMKRYNKFKTKKAKDKVLMLLVAKNVPLIISRVFHFCNVYDIDKTKESVEDLFVEGMMGFIKGMQNFEKQHSYKLVTYCTWWIDSYIRKFIKNITNTITYPDWVFYKPSGNSKLREDTKLALSLKTSISDKSRYVPVLVGKISDKNDSDESFVLESSLDGRRSEDIPYLFSTSKEILKAFRQSCTNKERRIIYYRLTEMKTLDELSKRFNISREGIRQIEVKAMNKVMKHGFEKGDIVSSVVFMHVNIPEFKKKFIENVI